MNLNSNRVVNVTYCDVAIFRYLLDCFHYGYRNQLFLEVTNVKGAKSGYIATFVQLPILANVA